MTLAHSGSQKTGSVPPHWRWHGPFLIRNYIFVFAIHSTVITFQELRDAHLALALQLQFTESRSQAFRPEKEKQHVENRFYGNASGRVVGSARRLRRSLRE
jgi:hypothetical protein